MTNNLVPYETPGMARLRREEAKRQQQKEQEQQDGGFFSGVLPAIGRAAEWYERSVADPTMGALGFAFSPSIRETYTEAREQGQGVGEALGTGWEEGITDTPSVKFDLPGEGIPLPFGKRLDEFQFGLKGAAELLGDPLNLLPGIGFGGQIARGAGRVGRAFRDPAMEMLERGTMGIVKPAYIVPPGGIPAGTAAQKAKALGLVKEGKYYYPKQLSGEADLTNAPIHKVVINGEDRLISWVDGGPGIGKEWFEYTDADAWMRIDVLNKGKTGRGAFDPDALRAYTKNDLIDQMKAQKPTPAPEAAAGARVAGELAREDVVQLYQMGFRGVPERTYAGGPEKIKEQIAAKAAGDKGACFECAHIGARLNEHLGAEFVQGMVNMGVNKRTGKPIKGIHAWVEVGDFVYDSSNPMIDVVPKAKFYADAAPKDIIRMTSREAEQLYNNAGPLGPYNPIEIRAARKAVASGKVPSTADITPPPVATAAATAIRVFREGDVFRLKLPNGTTQNIRVKGTPSKDKVVVELENGNFAEYDAAKLDNMIDQVEDVVEDTNAITPDTVLLGETKPLRELTSKEITEKKKTANPIRKGLLEKEENRQRRKGANYDETQFNSSASGAGPGARATGKTTDPIDARFNMDDQPTGGSAGDGTPPKDPDAPEMGGMGDGGDEVIRNAKQQTKVATAAELKRLINKLIRGLHSAKLLGPKIRAKATKARTAERKKRAAAGLGSLGREGAEGRIGAKAAAAGDLPVPDIDIADLKFSVDEIETLTRSIQDYYHSKGRFYDWMSADQIFTDLMLNGKLPTRKGMEYLEEVFGSEFAKALVGLTPRSISDKLLTLWNVPRALMATADLSAPLRQGALLMGEGGVWKDAWKPMIESALRNEWYVDELYKGMRADPLFEASQRAGLDLTIPSVSRGRSGTEEAFMGAEYAERIPFFGHVVKRSNRAYGAFLNKLRFDTFKKHYNALGDSAADEQLQELANNINLLSGRARLPGTGDVAERWQAVLNGMFFSPRFMLSRIQAPMKLIREVARANTWRRRDATGRLTAEAQLSRMVARDIMTYATSVIGMLYMGHASGVWKVETDVRSSDWGKIRIGDTRIDPWAGLQQPVRAAMLMFLGESKDIRGRVKKEALASRLGLFITSKQHPSLTAIQQLMTGKGFGGDVSKWEVFWNSITPMVAQDLMEIGNSEGLGAATKFAAPALFGMSVYNMPNQYLTGDANIDEELQRQGMFINRVGSSINNTPLTDDQRKAYEELTRQYIMERLPKLFRSVSYRGKSDAITRRGITSKQYAIQRVFDQSRAKARREIQRTLMRAA